MTLTLAQARQIIDGALAEARTRNMQPLAVIVLDRGGHPVVFAREDRASLFRFDIARAKAKGALGMGVNTRQLAERAKENQAFFASLSAVAKGDIAFSPGGVLIYDGAQEIIGAVGVSGDVGDLDEACALAGLACAGLAAAQSS